MKSIINRLFIVFTVFLLIVLTFFLWLFRYSTDNIQQNKIHSTNLQLEHAGYILDSEIKEAELNALSVLSDRLTINFTNHFNNDKQSYKYLKSFQDLRDMLSTQVKNSKGIESMTIYWPKQNETVSSYDILFDTLDFYGSTPNNG